MRKENVPQPIEEAGSVSHYAVASFGYDKVRIPLAEELYLDDVPTFVSRLRKETPTPDYQGHQSLNPDYLWIIQFQTDSSKETLLLSGEKQTHTTRIRETGNAFINCRIISGRDLKAELSRDLRGTPQLSDRLNAINDDARYARSPFGTYAEFNPVTDHSIQVSIAPPSN